METLEPTFDVRWEREYGVHDFELADGTAVKAVSQPTWEECLEALRQLEAEPGTIVLTPELITFPHDPAQLPGLDGEVMRRTIQVQAISAGLPGVTILLGTPSYLDGPANERPHNALVAIRDGNRSGEARKWLLNGFEQVSLRAAREFRVFEIAPRIGGLVCADLIGVRPLARQGTISDSFDALLVSTCWAVPLDPGLQTSGDERYLKALTDVTSWSFESLPSLRDIVIADRTFELSGTDNPFNAHFKRRS